MGIELFEFASQISRPASVMSNCIQGQVSLLHSVRAAVRCSISNPLPVCLIYVPGNSAASRIHMSPIFII